jgi:hypothetical protein
MAAQAKIGKPYSGLVDVNADGQRITMYRGPRQACRFYDADTGEQVGPEQSNVAPAIAWAMAHGFRLETP